MDEFKEIGSTVQDKGQSMKMVSEGRVEWMEKGFRGDLRDICRKKVKFPAAMMCFVHCDVT